MTKHLDALMVNRYASDLREKSVPLGIRWSWPPAYSPSTNGVVERAVKEVKQTIRKCVSKETLDFETLLTLTKEAKRVINSRPLSVVQHLSVEDPVPITPNHLLFGHSLNALPFMTPSRNASKKAQKVEEVWAQRQRLIKAFHSMYMEQYLQGLRTRQKWKKERDPIKENDLCLLSEPNRKRREWPIGLVTKVLYGRDNLPRSAILRTATGETTRSVSTLIHLRHMDEVDEPEEAAAPDAADDGEAGMEEDSGIPTTS